MDFDDLMELLRDLFFGVLFVLMLVVVLLCFLITIRNLWAVL